MARRRRTSQRSSSTAGGGALLGLLFTGMFAGIVALGTLGVALFRLIPPRYRVWVIAAFVALSIVAGLSSPTRVPAQAMVLAPTRPVVQALKAAVPTPTVTPQPTATTISTVAPTAEPTAVPLTRVIKGGNVRSEPRVADNTIQGQVCHLNLAPINGNARRI